MPVLPPDLKHRKQRREKTHEEGSRATDAPSGVVGVDHRRSGDGGPEFLIGGVNNPALRSEARGGLSQSALRQADSGSGRDDRRDFAQRQSKMIVQGERLRHDMGADAVCGGSVLTGCEA